MPFAFPGMYHDVFIKEHNVLQLHASLSKMNDLLAVSPEDVVRLNSKDAPRAQDKVRDLPVGNLQRSLSPHFFCRTAMALATPASAFGGRR
ncbi:uncharacterized protein LOC119185959 isoform X2 [Rhipicephalus microplus]|uniref:uncharacterized protein LOC119185959 isoform X2 n=1 Tax=Rhipicephalus microplus TaxID=6941 RepID=UPI003F6B286B